MLIKSVHFFLLQFLLVGLVACNAKNPVGTSNSTSSEAEKPPLSRVALKADTPQVCATARQGRTATLVCPEGQVVKSIEFAAYGTPAGTCGSYGVASCHSYTTHAIVEEACLGKASCAIEAKNSIFGDPCPKVAKKLVMQATCGDLVEGAPEPQPTPEQTPVPEPTPAPTPVPGAGTPVADEIFDSNGNLNASAYVALANDYSSDKAITYRFGAANTSPAAGAPTYWQPGDHIFYPHANECDGGNDKSLIIVMQLGKTDCTKNDYGSTAGDVIYRADSATDQGVTPLLSLDLSAGNISEKPQLFWIYNNSTRDPLLPSNVTKPIAMGRCVEHDCAQALIAFQNGVLGQVGSNTASQKTSFQFPAGKVPTAIAITNNSEFALVTIWDTVNLKGQVAVLALGSLADGPSDMAWPTLYPGLRNMSNFVFIKLLGFIDLPGMVAPTSIAAATDFAVMQDNGRSTQGWLYDPSGNAGASYSYQQLDLVASSTNQKSFAPGGLNYELLSHSGVAVVVSKSEKKAIFLNLKPLFDKVNSTYFQSTFTAMKATVANTGLGDSQWPPVFAVSNYAPTILKTVSLAQKPTAVKISVLANPGQAWIGTEDGVIHSYNVAGVQSGSNMDPSLITEVGSVQVGKNPTHMVHHVLAENFGASNTEIWVVSRGEQKVQLVDMVNKKVQKTLQDSRMIDPISVDETQQSPMMTSVISVTDYSGKKLMNFRYAPIKLQGGNTPLYIGIGQSGTDLFEYGGAYNTPGKPFGFTQSNVP